jgi:hypothetical protein
MVGRPDAIARRLRVRERPSNHKGRKEVETMIQFNIGKINVASHLPSYWDCSVPF